MDEWNYEKWRGEPVTVGARLENNSDSYERFHVRNARQPSLFLERYANVCNI